MSKYLRLFSLNSILCHFFSYNFLDFVITLCAEEICPVLPTKAKSLRWMHEDPANKKFNEIESKLAFKKVRDNIYNLLKKFMIDNL